MQVEPDTTPRVGAGLLAHRTFRQLVKFGLVGASGFIVNVSVFAFCLRVLGIHYRFAYVIAFCVAVSNNFVWNRLWTFRQQRNGSHVAMQGARFFAVSLVAATGGFVLLEVFVRAGLPKIPGEMLAVALVVPISFLGNKHWSFR
jgi:dolichol-phosphate mannosyltransferase